MLNISLRQLPRLRYELCLDMVVDIGGRPSHDEGAWLLGNVDLTSILVSLALVVKNLEVMQDFSINKNPLSLALKPQDTHCQYSCMLTLEEDCYLEDQGDLASGLLGLTSHRIYWLSSSDPPSRRVQYSGELVVRRWGVAVA